VFVPGQRSDWSAGARVGGAVPLIALAVLIAGCGEKEENLDAGATTGTVGATTVAEPASEIAGGWTGQLTQKDLPPFQIGVVIDPGGSGLVAYTGINCGGKWAPKFATPPAAGAEYLFEERINEGAGGSCKGTGTVALAQAADMLSYRFTGGGVTSSGVLSRTGFDQVFAVFKRAGLNVSRTVVADKLPPG
jgi:hypothetical protein